MELIFMFIYLGIFVISTLFLLISFVKKDYNLNLVFNNIELFSSSTILLLILYLLSLVTNYKRVWTTTCLYSIWFILTKFTVHIIS